MLAAAGLVAATVTHSYSDTVPADQVMGQDPAAGESVQCGSAVALLVSDGRAPVSDLVARCKSAKVQLTWTHIGASSYNVYRSTVSGGPYTLVGNTDSTYSTYLDTGLTNGTTYYYVVTEAGSDTISNEASATPIAGRTRRSR